MSITTGRIGRYLIERKLSEGGMAKVFLARTDNVVGFDKRVVLKCVLPAHAGDPRFAAMLLAEARIAAALNHAHIVQVLDLVEHEGRHFMVMELLDGQATRAMLRRAAELKVRIAPAVSCRIIADLLGGLAYAHDRRDGEGQPLGLVHRDVSPANVVVTWSGCVKLIDFGIAKATEQLGEELTRAGQRKGKSSYMSPEQVRGQALDRRSDLFSTGILLWELLTGRRLFARPNDLESMLAICKEDALPPSTLAPGLPPELDAICQRALCRDLDARYSDATTMRRDLEQLILTQHWDSSPLAVERQLSALFTNSFVDDPTTARPPAAPAEQSVLSTDAPSPVEPAEEPAPVVKGGAELDTFEGFTEIRAKGVVRTMYDGWATDQMSAAPGPVRKHRLRRALFAAAACFAIGAAGCAAAVHYLG